MAPMPGKKAVFQASAAPTTPAPPAALELREAAERAPVVAPGIAPTRPVQTPLYDQIDVDEAELPRLDREAAARELIEVLSAQLEATRDRARRGRLHYEWARLAEEPLHDGAQALTHYKQAHDLAPEHEPSVAGVRRVLLNKGEFEAALPWFDEQARLCPTPAGKAELAYEKALLLEGPLGRPAEARKALEQARETLPQDAGILRALARARRRDQAWAELERCMEVQAQESEADDRLLAARLAERARLIEVKRRDADGAAALFQSAFARSPATTVALFDLERLHGAAQRAQELISVLESRVRLAVQPEVKAAALERLARVFIDRLGDAVAGAAALERAHEQLPRSLAILHELSVVYERTGHFRGLESTLQRLEALATDPAEKVALRARLGELEERDIGDLNRAVAEYERARALDPVHTVVVDALGRLYAQAGAHERRIAVLEGFAAASTDVGARADAHLRVAGIQESELGDKLSAIESCKRVLGLVPGQAAAFAILVRLLAELGRHAELIEQYERAVEQAEDDAGAFAWLFKIGRLYEDALGQPGRALETYQRVLAKAPGHLDALMAGERCAERAGQHAILVDLLEAHAGLSPGLRKLQLLCRAADVAAGELGHEARALALLKGVLAIDPRFAPALASLRRIHERAGRTTDLIDVYERELGLAADGATRARILFAVGELYERSLGQDEPAIAHYKKALEHDAGHEAASQALSRRLNATERYEELARHLSREIERRKEPARKAEAALSLGQLHEGRLKKAPEALKAYEACLEHAPGTRAAIEGRQRILASTGNHKALVVALDEDAATTSEPSVKLQASLRAAEILRDDLGQLEDAAQRYQAVLADHPGHAQALLALEHLYSELGHTDKLGAVLLAQVEAFEPVVEQVGALRELWRLGGHEGALGQILGRLPDDRRALEARERAALRAGEVDALAQVDSALLQSAGSGPATLSAHATRFAEYLESREPWKALQHFRRALSLDAENIAAARGIGRIALGTADPALLEEAAEAEARVTLDLRRAARFFSLAAAAENARGNAEKAAALLERSLDVHPEDFAAARALHGLLTTTAEYDRLITALGSAAQRSQSVEARTGHWIAVARTHATYKHDLPAALTALLRVEKAEPGHGATLLELGELYMRDRQFQQAATRFERVAKLPLKPAQLLQVRLRLAALYQEHLGRPAEARTLLGEILADEPLHREALRRLIALQLAAKDPAAAATARAWVDASEGTEKAEGLTTLGRLHRDQGRIADAREALEAAVRLVGKGEPGPAADLRQILGEAGGAEGWEGYAAALSQFTETARDEGAAAEAYVELGRVYLDELSDKTRGFPALERGLAALPEATPLRVEYSTRLMKAGLHAQALDELRRLLALDAARADTWRDLVATFDALGRNAEAHLAQGPLVLSGGGSELSRSMWRSRSPRPALVGDDAVGAGVLELFSPDVPGESAAFLAQLSELGSKLFGPGLERFGVSSKDRVGSRSTHPLRPLFDRVVRAFGVVEMDLYPASEYDGALTLVLTDPIGLVVPRSFAGLSEVEQVFGFARFVASVARGTHLVDVLNDPELDDLVVAGARVVEPRFAAERSAGRDLDALSRKIAKALPWLSKGRFEEVARRYTQSRPPSGAVIGKRLRASLLRVAMILADDVTPLLLLQRTRGVMLGLSPDESKSAQLDLLQAWVSEASIEARKRVGLL